MMSAMLKRLKCERGATELVEFAGLFPLFLALVMLFMQCVDAGHTYITAMSASREGARAAIVGDDCEAAAARLSHLWELDERQVQCGCDYLNCEVTVQLRLRRLRLPYVGEILNNYWIPYSTVMRNER